MPISLRFSFIPLSLVRNVLVLAIIMLPYSQMSLKLIFKDFSPPKFLKFGLIFQTARLFHPARLLDTLE